MKREGPPAFFHAFFRWYCNPSFMRNIEGDLLEFYHERVKALGRQKADFLFVRDVIRLFRPAVIRRFNIYELIPTFGMYRNHLKTAWRNLLNNKAFSAINISGLTLGLACSILIGLWVNDELQMDKFHNDIDRIYTVTSVEYSGDEVNGSYYTPGLLGEELPKVFPEVEFAANFGWTQYHTFAVAEKKMRIQGNFAGDDFFKIFSYPLIAGSKDNLLRAPESIVISKKMAKSFFGSPEQALDKTLRFETYKDLKVTGVFDDIGDNSSEKFEYIISWQLMMERNQWLKDWRNSGPTAYVKLKPGTDAVMMNEKIREFIKNYDKQYSKLLRLELGLQPYGETYLHSTFRNGKISGGRIEYVNLFKLVAIFLLVIACVNFMNLSTARSVKRAREIGVRKTIGAQRTTLIGQFMTEAFVITLIAVVLALGLLNVMLTPFNLLTGKNIPSPLTDISFWSWMFGITMFTTMMSGMYPAVVLSSFRPAVVLKKAVYNVNTASGLVRKGLVVFQFSLSIIFIIGMIVVSQQVNFIQSTNIGYEKDNLLYVPISGRMAVSFDAYKRELLRQPGIVDVTYMSDRPVEIGNSTGGVEWEGKDPETRPTFTQAQVGYDFIRTTQTKLVLGRDFLPEANDSSNFIINETALKILGYKNPIGMPLTLWDIKGTIVGVVKDFHFNTLHVAIDPLILRLGKGRMWGWTLIRINAGHTQESLEAIGSLQAKFSPEVPFTYQFADEEYGMLYQREKIVQQLSRYFAGMAIFISCLGLLGSVIFAAAQRTKEVSIRKVMGANVRQIVTLLSSDFIKLVVIAAAISFPISYYIVRDWLNGFQYHVDIEWWTFLVSGLGAVVIALATVLFHAVKAAVSNPVDALKSE